jgi:hypothetical protein
MSDVIEKDDGTLAFPGLGYSDESLNQLWMWIRDDLANEGRVYNQKIVEKHEKNPAGYSKTTLSGALSKLRPALAQAGIIDVEYESPGEDDDGKGGATRNLWVIDQ